MKKIFLFSGLAIGCLFFLAALVAGTPANRPAVNYPEGYRQWTHVKSMVILDGHPLYASFGGIHHVYANAVALNAMKQAKPFPDGAVLVFDLLEAEAENHAIVEGPRKLLGVMQKDSKEFRATGGWGFEAFKGDTRQRAVTNPDTECFACHKAQTQSDYVFSKYRP
jgi:hypothetical protein